MKKMFSNLPAELMSAWYDANNKDPNEDTSNDSDINEAKIRDINQNK